MTSKAYTYVILVNWRSWADTIECLESLLRIEGEGVRVVVCDNGSGDGSIEKIVAWARGDLPATTTGPLERYTTPAIRKPVPLSVLTREDAEAGGQPEDASLVVIDTGGNLGFAGGNNVGLRYAMKRGDLRDAWLLNNDTVVDPAALTALQQRMREDPAIGICGSVLVEYHRPDTIQALGGAYHSKWTARGYHLGARLKFPDAVPASPGEVEMRTSYVVGASMLVSREFLDRVGLMEEDYFLYCEEIDWAERARANGQFKLGFAPKSVVYHKVGGSTPKATQRNAWALEMMYANKLTVTKRFFPGYLWVNRAWYFIEILKAVIKRDWIRGRVFLRVLLGYRPSLP